MKMRGLDNKGFTIGEFTAVFMIVLVIVFLLQPFIRRIHDRSDRVACANNLRQLGKAIYVYAREHHGEFPGTLKALYDEQYLADARFVDCPASRHKGTPDDPDYIYAPGLSVNDPSTDILLRGRPGSHPDGGNALHVNGAISWEEK
ncbi:MAG: hypothetical protein KAS86_05285 [Candidatus Omnitrophica bacterium]|nr:hypothetical protein [Candidatus Omnitrophota bacterium]